MRRTIPAAPAGRFKDEERHRPLESWCIRAGVSDTLEDALAGLDAGGESPVYLLAGEEFLVRQAADKLLAKLMPKQAADLNLVVMDGVAPKDVVAELATLPMFGGRKVVYCRDPEFLAPKKGRADALGRAREAWKANRKKEAALRVLGLAAKAGWTVADLDPERSGAPRADEWERELGVSLASADVDFLKEVQSFCEAEGIKAPAQDEAALADWVSAHPAKGQVLVIATTELDAKNPFVKKAKDAGIFLEFRAASRLKDLDLSGFAREALAPHKKKMAPGALELLKERVGGNFRLLQSELTKLALHCEGDAITVKDVNLLVGHAREDEFFELTEAIQKRSFEAASRFIADAVAQGSHPIMLLGSIASVVRNMLMAYERMMALSQGRPPRSYPDFQARVWPKIEAETKAAKARMPHPYAAFMGMQAAAGYGRQELLAALVACAEADLALKLGGDALVLERLIWTLAGKASPWVSGMHVIRREQER
jgi:DNA polymerase III subunit delta